jgi:hypothetical protein
LAAESIVKGPVQLDAWMLDGAGFEVAFDAETNFNLLQVSSTTSNGSGVAALVVRVRPNEDLCQALEAICVAHGIRKGRVCGGVGSLIGAVFEDGRVVEPFVTEVFIKSGSIEPGSGGELQAQVDVGLVAHTGEMAEGRLKRGHNPVLITFELVIEIQEWQDGAGASFDDSIAGRQQATH